MIDRNFKRAELIKHRTYVENGHVLLELAYRIWYEDGSIAKLHIPKIELPLSSACPPNIITKSWAFSDEAYIPATDKLLVLETKDIKYRIPGADGRLEGLSGTNKYFFVIEKEPDTVEMTVEEIEKALGKKIKIIGDKNKGGKTIMKKYNDQGQLVYMSCYICEFCKEMYEDFVLQFLEPFGISKSDLYKEPCRVAVLTVEDSYSLVKDDRYHRFYIDGVYQFTIEESMVYAWNADDGLRGKVIFKKLVEAERIGEKAEDVC